MDSAITRIVYIVDLDTDYQDEVVFKMRSNQTLDHLLGGIRWRFYF